MLNQGNWRATKTTLGTEDHQLRMVVISILRKVLSLNHEKILILLSMIQIINSNLLGLKYFMVTNIIIGVYYRHPKKTQMTYFLKI